MIKKGTILSKLLWILVFCCSMVEYGCTEKDMIMMLEAASRGMEQANANRANMAQKSSFSNDDCKPKSFTVYGPNGEMTFCDVDYLCDVTCY